MLSAEKFRQAVAWFEEPRAGYYIHAYGAYGQADFCTYRCVWCTVSGLEVGSFRVEKGGFYTENSDIGIMLSTMIELLPQPMEFSSVVYPPGSVFGASPEDVSIATGIPMVMLGIGDVIGSNLITAWVCAQLTLPPVRAIEMLKETL